MAWIQIQVLSFSNHKIWGKLQDIVSIESYICVQHSAWHPAAEQTIISALKVKEFNLIFDSVDQSQF